jgi:hypothetical protein
VDGTDTFSTQDGTPHITGARANAGGFDLNRDGVKLETIEVNGLYQNVLNRWDPVLFFDAHLMGRVKHGYANAYATSTVPAAHPAPRAYVWDTLFPAVRAACGDFGLETYTHALFDEQQWPPTEWSHDRAIWSVEAKFVVSDYGFRNRMAILTERRPAIRHSSAHLRAHAQPSRRSSSTPTRTGPRCRRSARRRRGHGGRRNAKAESGKLKNWVEGKTSRADRSRSSPTGQTTPRICRNEHAPTKPGPQAGP